jgi:hypothetical protein
MWDAVRAPIGPCRAVRQIGINVADVREIVLAALHKPDNVGASWAYAIVAERLYLLIGCWHLTSLFKLANA